MPIPTQLSQLTPTLGKTSSIVVLNRVSASLFFIPHISNNSVETLCFAVSKYQIVNGLILINPSLLEPSVARAYGSVFVIFISSDLKKITSRIGVS